MNNQKENIAAYQILTMYIFLYIFCSLLFDVCNENNNIAVKEYYSKMDPCDALSSSIYRISLYVYVSVFILLNQSINLY